MDDFDPIDPMGKGKSTPSNEEAERQLLGGIFLQPEWLEELGDVLRPDDFWKVSHGTLWEWMLKEWRAGRQVDVVTIFDRMPQPLWSKVGGIAYVVELPDRVPSTANLNHYAQVIAELASRRRMIEHARRWIDLALEPDPEGSLLEVVVADLQQIRMPGATRGEWVKDTVTAYSKENDEIAERGTPPQFKLGWRDVDAKLKVSPGDLIIVGARPGMGKTAWALNGLLWRAGKLGQPGGMFSMEMSRRQLMDRLVATRSGVNLDVVKTVTMRSQEDWDRIIAAEDEIKGLPIIVDYRSSLTVEDLRAEARRMVSLEGVDLIVVDYLQLMRPTDSRAKREQAVAHISRELKNMARDFGIAVVALAQVNRECESRSDKRPLASDLRDSGTIEQDADAIVVLYRDHKYNRSHQNRHDAEVIIRKQRNGPSGTVKLRWFGETQLFVNDLTPEQRRAKAAAAQAKKEAKEKKPPQDDSAKQESLPT